MVKRLVTEVQHGGIDIRMEWSTPAYVGLRFWSGKTEFAKWMPFMDVLGRKSPDSRIIMESAG